MKKYLRLYWKFVSTSIVREMEFRSGFFVLILSELFQDLFILAFFSVLFGTVTTVKDWTYPEALFLMGTFMLLTYITQGLFYRNFARISEYVNEGKLDLLLTKPIDSQFIMTTRYTAVADLFNIVPSLIVLGYAINRLHEPVTITAIVGYVSLLVLGVIIVYGLWFAISLLAFWLTEIEEIQELWNGLFDYTKYPRQIFDGAIKILFTLVIPILTIVAFPAEFFLGRIGASAIIINLSLGLVILVVTRVLWNVGVRRYSSASS